MFDTAKDVLTSAAALKMKCLRTSVCAYPFMVPNRSCAPFQAP